VIDGLASFQTGFVGVRAGVAVFAVGFAIGDCFGRAEGMI